MVIDSKAEFFWSEIKQEEIDFLKSIRLKNHFVIDSKAKSLWNETKQKEIIFTNGKQRQLTVLIDST